MSKVEYLPPSLFPSPEDSLTCALVPSYLLESIHSSMVAELSCTDGLDRDGTFIKSNSCFSNLTQTPCTPGPIAVAFPLRREIRSLMSSCVKHFYCSLGEIPLESLFSPLKSECEVCKLTSALHSNAFSNTALKVPTPPLFISIFIIDFFFGGHIRTHFRNSGYLLLFPQSLPEI